MQTYTVYTHIETHNHIPIHIHAHRNTLHSHFVIQKELCDQREFCILWQQQENNIPAIGFGKTCAPVAYLLALVHLVHYDEAASETFCLFERCAPGNITCFGGEDTGLPNVTSTGGAPPCMTLLLATGLPICFIKAGRWEKLAVRARLFQDVFPLNEF